MLLKQQLSEPFRPALVAHFLLALPVWKPDTKSVRTISCPAAVWADIAFKGSAMGTEHEKLGSREFNSEVPDQKNLLCHTWLP